MNSTTPNSGFATYQVIADEYYDARRHPTCNNFNRLSRIYLSRHVESLAQRRVLETGAGSSAAAELLSEAGLPLRGLTITDSCGLMLSHSQKWTAHGAELRVADAEQLDVEADSIDVLVSSLGDPYNTSAFWLEVSRVLRRDGLAIFTMPSFQWAARFRSTQREPLDKAEFRLRDGSAVHVRSIIPPLDAQVEIIERTGLVVVDFEDLGAGQLDAHSLSPKTQVFGDEPSSLVWGFVARKATKSVSASLRRSWRESRP